MLYGRHLQCFLFVLIITENDRRQTEGGRRREAEREEREAMSKRKEPVPAAK